jgi:uncharacterized membrane protein YkvA (DUF1232 family)
VKTPLKRILLWLIGAAVYVLWPLDALPDTLPALGWIDDALVAGLAVYRAYRAYRDWHIRMKGPR